MTSCADTKIKRKLCDLRVIDLRNELEKRDLDKTGVKTELMERLQKAVEDEGHDCEEYLFEVTEASLKKSTNGVSKEGSERDDSSENGASKERGHKPSNEILKKSRHVDTVETKNSEKKKEEAVTDIQESECAISDTHRDSVVKTDGGKKDISGEETVVKIASERDYEVTELTHSTPIPAKEQSVKSGEEQGVHENVDGLEMMITNEDSALDVHVFDPENDLDADILNNGKGNRATTKSTVGTKAEEQGECADELKTEEVVKTSSPQSTQVDRSPEKKKDDSKTAKSTTPKESKSDLKKSSDESASLSEKNLWISGLAPTVKAVDLKSLFGKHGKLLGAKIVTNVKKPGSKCYGFILMSSAEEAKKCIQHFDKTELHGRTISVEKAKANLGTKALSAKKTPEAKKDKSGVRKDDKGKESSRRESPRRHRRSPDRKDRYHARRYRRSSHSDRKHSRSRDRKDDMKKNEKKETQKVDKKEKKKSDVADDKSEQKEEENDIKKEDGQEDAKSETKDDSKSDVHKHSSSRKSVISETHSKEPDKKKSTKRRSYSRSYSRSHSGSRSRSRSRDSKYELEKKITLHFKNRLKLARRQILKLNTINKELSIKLMKQRRDHGDQMRLQATRMRRFRDEFEREKLEIKLEREIVRREKEEFRNEMMSFRQEEAMRRSSLKRNYDSRGARDDNTYFADSKRPAMTSDNRYDSYASKRPVFIEDGRRDSRGGRVADRRNSGDRFRISDRTSHDHTRSSSRGSPIRGQRQKWGDSSWNSVNTNNAGRQSDRFSGSGNMRGRQDRSSSYSMQRGTVSSNMNSGMYMNSGPSQSGMMRDGGSMGNRHQDNRYGGSGGSGNMRRY